MKFNNIKYARAVNNVCVYLTTDKGNDKAVYWFAPDKTFWYANAMQGEAGHIKDDKIHVSTRRRARIIAYLKYHEAKYPRLH